MPLVPVKEAKDWDLLFRSIVPPVSASELLELKDPPVSSCKVPLAMLIVPVKVLAEPMVVIEVEILERLAGPPALSPMAAFKAPDCVTITEE